MYFGIYDTVNEKYMKNSKINIFEKFLIANSIVIFSETVSYPTDTVKRRLMM